MIWRATSAFLSSGSADLPASIVGSLSLKWTFSTPKKFSMFSIKPTIVSCKMSTGSFETHGTGESLSLRSAIIRAFAESWERIWLKFVAQGMVPGVEGAATSNGFAAGPSDSSALDRARGEIIERAVMLEAWRNMSGWQPLRSLSLVEHVLVSNVERQGWKVQCFLLRSDYRHVVLAVLATSPKFGAVFDCVYGGIDKPRRAAQRRLITSLGRMTAFAESSVALDDKALPDVGCPADHREFYRKPENLQAFAFLDNPASASGIQNIPQLSSVVVRLLHPAGRFPAVAAAWQRDLPQLNWGSLSIGGKNRWPHPLA